MNIVYIYIDYEKSNFPQNVEIKAQNVEIKGIIVTPQIMHVMGILQLQVLASECSLHQRRARHLKHQQPGKFLPKQSFDPGIQTRKRSKQNVGSVFQIFH